VDQVQQKTLLEVLRKRQEKFGYLAKEFIAEAAKSWSISESELYELVISFPFLHTQPQGKNVIRVCKGKPCSIYKSGIIDVLKKEVGISPGETTPDGKFSIDLVNCLSACEQPPAIKINDDLYVEMDPSKIAQILRKY
jgi:NADH:ubiquinone oxidoreductase subunit E